MRFRFPFNWYNKFGTIPSEFREAMSYEEQILWLCQAHADLQAQFDAFKVSIEDLQIRVENLEGAIVNKQDKLIAGNNIFFDNEYIDAYLSDDLSSDIVSGSYIDLSGEIGSVVDLTPIEASNTSYISLNVAPDEEYIIYGKCTFGKLNEENELVSKFSFNPAESPYVKYKVLNDVGKLVVSWENTDKYVPFFYLNLSANYIYGKFKSIPDWVTEDQTSLVTSISEDSTDDEVPTAKAVYTALGGGGSTSYNDLSDKPSINGVTLEGDLSTADLDIETGIPVLQDDTFNVWNLENGVYLIKNNQTTSLYAGDIQIPIGIGDDSCLLFVYGASSIVPKGYMLLQMGSTNYRPLLEVGYCTSENSGTRITQNANSLSYGVNQVNTMGNSQVLVPTEYSVKNYVDTQIGNIATILQNINTGTGV